MYFNCNIWIDQSSAYVRTSLYLRISYIESTQFSVKIVFKNKRKMAIIENQYINGIDNLRNRNKKLVSNDERCREGVKYAVELNRIIANVIGIWPAIPENSRTSEFNFELVAKRIKNGIFYFLLLLLLIPGILHILLEERTLKRRISKVYAIF